MNTNEKGQVALAKVIADLTEKGYSVFLPIGDHLPIDLIAVNEKMVSRRIQVKYKSLPKSGRIDIVFASVVNGKKVPINFDYIDGFAVYNPEQNRVFYFPKRKIDTKKCLFGCRFSGGDRTSTLCEDVDDVNGIWED